MSRLTPAAATATIPNSQERYEGGDQHGPEREHADPEKGHGAVS
jgi:hypothetical protein